MAEEPIGGLPAPFPPRKTSSEAADFGFQGGVGWNPSFVFRALREMGLLEGPFDEVVREAWRRDRVRQR